MEPTENQPVTVSENVPTEFSKNKLGKKKFLLILIPVILIPFILGIIYIFSNSNKKPADPEMPIVSEAETSQDNFFKTSLANEFENITTEDLPHSRLIGGVARYKDSLWISGDGTLIEYDAKTNKIKRFSDPKISRCDTSVVIVGDFLYTPCRIFASSPGEDYPPYSIYKINLKNYKIEKIIDNKTGLQNDLNLKLYKDGETIWIATYQGVGKLNTKDDSITFYNKELGIKSNSYEETHYGVNNILVDEDVVWAVVTASAYSSGGVSLFDKNTKKWTPFGPVEIGKSIKGQDRIDFDGVMLTPKGLRVAYSDSQETNPNDLLIEKEYSHVDKKWTIISNNRESTGINSNPTREYIKQTYKSNLEEGLEDSEGNIQIYSPDGKMLNQINGRAFLWISNLIGDKRYLITSSTFDVLKRSGKFPEILFKFGKNYDYSQPHPTDPGVKFLSTQDNAYAVLIDPAYFPGFEGPEYWDTMFVWVVDLKTDKLIKKFSSDTKYEWRKTFGYESELIPSESEEQSIKRNGDVITVFTGGKPMFEYNIASQSINYIN